MRTKIILVCVALCIAVVAVGAATAPDDAYDKLYSAIRSDDLREIKRLLDGGVSASTVGPAPEMAAATPCARSVATSSVLAG